MTIDATLIVLTLNEEKHLPRLFKSIEGVFERVVVVDSFSTDRTEEIARANGAEFYQRAFINNADQFAWGMTRDITTEWTMKLDADEVLEAGFVEEFETRVKTFGPDVTGIELWWKVIFWNRRIHHGGRSPAYLLRVWKTGMGSMEQRWMDEHIVLQTGRSVRFKHGFSDWNLNNITFFTRKHNVYATREAVAQLLAHELNDGSSKTIHMSSNWRFKRLIKQHVYYKLPNMLSPFLYFFYRYILRAGFLDGGPGFVYHVLQGLWYRFLVSAKTLELRRMTKTAKTRAEKIAIVRAFTGLKISG